MLLTGMSAASCLPADNYHSFCSVPSTGWSKNDTLYLQLQEQREESQCQAYIEIRHTQEYPYQSVWLLVSHNEADSLTFRTDTIECRLTDNTGKFDGNGLSGSYQKSIPFKAIRLQKNTDPLFKITHFMKEKEIQGITDIGIRLSYGQNLSE